VYIRVICVVIILCYFVMALGAVKLQECW